MQGEQREQVTLKWHLNATNAQEPGSAKPVGVQERLRVLESAALTKQSETVPSVADHGYARSARAPALFDRASVLQANQVAELAHNRAMHESEADKWELGQVGVHRNTNR